MAKQTDHVELMTKLAVFEATVNGKFDSVINHLAQLNGQTAKNTGAINQLQVQDRDIMNMVATQKTMEENKQIKEDGWKRSWQNLLFGTLQWVLPAIIIGLLVNGTKVAEFLGF